MLMNFSSSQKLYLIAFVSLFFKIIIVFFFHEKALTDEWSILFNNFYKVKFFSYYNFENLYVPTSYMPPLYFFFILFCKYVSFEIFNYLYIIYFFQLLISTLSIFVFFNFCKKFLSDHNLCLFGVLIFSFFPLVVIATALISSATLQIYLYLIVINYFLDLVDEKKTNLIKISVVSSLCLLLRGEFIIIFIFSLIFIAILKKKKLPKCLLIFLITTLIISPYLLRNYLNTGKVHIVNVSGYALWKGNNHLSRAEGFANPLHPNSRNKWPTDPKFERLYLKLDNIKKDKNYEINRDSVFLDEAINNIIDNKSKYFKLYLNKLFSFYFIDLNSSYPHYYNIFNIAPLIIVSFLSVPTFILSLKVFKTKNYKLAYLTLIIIILTFTLSIFNILPRYKVSIISIQILYSLLFLSKFFQKTK